MICPVCGTENNANTAVCRNPDCRYQIRTDTGGFKTRLLDPLSAAPDGGGLIAGRYEVIEELGRGGMGVVFRVRDTRLRGRELALKMIHPELVAQEEARQRFMDEVLLCLELRHPNIVVVYHLEESRSSLFYTMEYIPGISLRRLMDSRKGQVPPFSLGETLDLMTQVLDALSYAHETTIHRDLKPGNILVQGDFPSGRIKILDFGIAKVLSATSFTRTAQSMGTAYYMSPEQMKGAKNIDSRSDLYSVGMILYEMLTGEMGAGLFEMPSDLVPELPGSIDGVIKSTLSQKVEKRYSSALEMKQALEKIIGEKIIEGEKKTEEKGGIAKENLGRTKKPVKEIPPQPKAEKTWTDPVTGMAFVYVPSGSFEMGQSDAEKNYIIQHSGIEEYRQCYKYELPRHTVSLDGFWMGKYEVTNGQYRQFKSEHDSGSFKDEDLNDDSQPAVRVSWEDAKAFTAWLNEKSSHRFALPSEAQWEYAARGGTSTIRFWGDEADQACAWANVADESVKLTWPDWTINWSVHNCSDGYAVTSPVGKFRPNGFGLYDMLGNVDEWCEDVFDTNAYSKLEHGRKNPLVTSGDSRRVHRGGSWCSDPAEARCAQRSRGLPSLRLHTLGFRLIRKD